VVATLHWQTELQLQSGRFKKGSVRVTIGKLPLSSRNDATMR
jgi:hypothetical protein